MSLPSSLTLMLPIVTFAAGFVVARAFHARDRQRIRHLTTYLQGMKLRFDRIDRRPRVARHR